jgi:hypothetical protein
VILLGSLTEQGKFEDVPHWYVKVLLEAEHFKVHAQIIEDML